MSSVASSAAASATSTCASVSYSTFPTEDVGCATASTGGLPSNYSDFMKGCCKTAPVESWANDCALYCLSIGQSVGDLNTCFQSAGIAPSDIICNANLSASATATKAPDSTSNPSGTAAGSGSTAGATKGAAVALVPQQGVSKAGLGMLVMLFVSGAVGALL
ncbi:hypothetical protein K491DRAFT_447658 [Lophiostoma macrostomum CBS 122681]|uniref:Uncharacterized protein n=1 Tax=Lophiostoma macrostomum CBS 122681 TaxID=1314788 RepID=A0A6A6TP94_9PLEO|nr:hypothetical protein K491DRAFT_447658 [Lophiostoma macrostomum CBS 122681]